jgi:hypothetical protein
MNTQNPMLAMKLMRMARATFRLGTALAASVRYCLTVILDVLSTAAAGFLEPISGSRKPRSRVRTRPPAPIYRKGTRHPWDAAIAPVSHGPAKPPTEKKVEMRPSMAPRFFGKASPTYDQMVTE